MRRVIGMDVHRTFTKVMFWEEGRLRPAGRVDMTRWQPSRKGGARGPAYATTSRNSGTAGSESPVRPSAPTSMRAAIGGRRRQSGGARAP